MREFLFSFLMCAATLSFAQDWEVKLKKRGPDKDYYSHLYLGFGWPVGPNPADSIHFKPGITHSFQLGWLYKKKILSFYQIGFGAEYQYTTYYFYQANKKSFPSVGTHTTEKLRFNYLTANVFQRFQLHSRENSTGIFIDMVGWASLMPKATLVSIDFPTAPLSPKRIKVKSHGLANISNYAYGVTGRLGFNRWIFYYRYRLSDMFTTKNIPEFQRHEVGIVLGIHN